MAHKIKFDVEYKSNKTRIERVTKLIQHIGLDSITEIESSVTRCNIYRGIQTDIDLHAVCVS